MAQPNMGSVHANRPLDQVAIAYSQDEYVLDQVFPTVQVQKESDTLIRWTKGDFFRDEARAVAPGALAPRGGFTLDTALTYTTVCNKFAWAVPDRVLENMDTPVRAMVDATKLAMDKVLLRREILIATLLSTAANWSATYGAFNGTMAIAGGSEWNTVNGVPIDDVQIARWAVRQTIGRRANTLVISEETFDALCNNAQIIARVRNTIVDRPVDLNLAALQTALRIPRIIVCSAIRNTAAEGVTPVLAPILGDVAWIGYVAPSPSLISPSAGYVFRKSAPATRTWREDGREQDVVEASENIAVSVTAGDAGFLITNTLAEV